MLLSVVMANYNHSAFLVARISSILDQFEGDLQDSELIIVDDVSIDNSASIIKSFAENDPRVKLLKNSKNSGPILSTHKALQHAQGMYIASLSADDKVLPGFFQKTIQALLEHPHIPLCCSDCGITFDGDPMKDPSKIETIKLLETEDKLRVFLPDQLHHIFRTTSFWIPGHTVITKKGTFMRYGGLDEGLGFLSDWFLFHSIALQEGILYIPQTLSVIRHCLDSFSGVAKANKQRKKEIYLHLLKTLSQPTNRGLRRAYRRAGILSAFVRQIIPHLVFRPRYWDFIAVGIRKRIIKKFSQLCISKKRSPKELMNI